MQSEKFGRLFVGARCPGARQLNSDCGLSPTNGWNARLRSVAANVATPCASAIVGEGELPRSQCTVGDQDACRHRNAVALLDVDECARPESARDDRDRDRDAGSIERGDDRRRRLHDLRGERRRGVRSASRIATAERRRRSRRGRPVLSGHQRDPFRNRKGAALGRPLSTSSSQALRQHLAARAAGTQCRGHHREAGVVDSRRDLREVVDPGVRVQTVLGRRTSAQEPGELADGTRDSAGTAGDVQVGATGRRDRRSGVADEVARTGRLRTVGVTLEGDVVDRATDRVRVGDDAAELGRMPLIGDATAWNDCAWPRVRSTGR